MRLERSELELEVIHRRIQAGEIDLQPDFQRGEVWNRSRRQRLIDTIIRGWYVPAIHIIFDESSSVDFVLDGQQRLAAIREFLEDRLVVDGQTHPRSPEIIALDGLRYSQLPLELQRAIRRFPVTVVTLRRFEPDEPYELFFRLNQHLPLTPSEKRNALYGPARDQVKSIVSRLTEERLLAKEVVGFANGRLAYDDVISRFGLVVSQGNLLQPLTNTRIEDFFREGEFSQDELGRVEFAASEFLRAARSVAPIKFNKATLFSWLVVTYSLSRRGIRPPSGGLISEFEHSRGQIGRLVEHGNILPPNYEISGALALYNDRASYRVSDTLSIVLRDLVLHLAISKLGHRITDPRIAHLLDSDALSHEGPAESLLRRFVDLEGWGHSL